MMTGAPVNGRKQITAQSQAFGNSRRIVATTSPKNLFDICKPDLLDTVDVRELSHAVFKNYDGAVEPQTSLE